MQRHGEAYRLGAAWELDVGRSELRRAGVPVELRPKPFQVLLFLVANRDRFVSKDEVLDAVWADVTVSESALTSAVKAVRRAFDDRAAEPSFIDSKRGRGYRFIAPVERLEPDAAEPGEVAAAGAGFFGRIVLLGALEAAAREANAGGGRLVVLRGEAGIGKTRAVEELQGRLRGSPMLQVSVRCIDDRACPPFWPWIQVIRQLHRKGSAALESHPAWSRLGPIGGASEPLGGALADEPREPELRFALYEACGELLREAASDAGLLVFLDDLHGADDASLQLLDFVVRDLADSRVFIVATLREPGAAQSAALARTLASISRSRSFEQHHLPPLAEGEARELVIDCAPVALSGSVVEEIVARADGSPFFARELARTGGLGAGGNAGVPAAVQDTIRARLLGLSEAAVRILEIAGVIGREFSLETIVAVEGGGVDALAAGLDEAIVQGFVRPVDDRFEFEHDLVRAAVQAHLGHRRVTELHLEVALALRDGSEEAAPDEIAHHFGAVGTREAAALAAEYSYQAGRRAMRVLAFESAAEHFGRAIAALDLLREPDWLLHFDAHVGLADAGLSYGRAGSEVLESVLAAAELARIHGDSDRLCEAALRADPGERFPGVDPRVNSLVEEALAARAGPRDALRARLLCKRAHLLRQQGQRAGLARSVAEEALALARQLDDPHALCAALRCHAQISELPAEERLASVRELIERARGAALPGMVLTGAYLEFPLLVELGDPGARGSLERAAGVDGAQAVPSARAHTLARYASLAILEGDLERAEQRVLEGLSVSRTHRPIRLLLLTSRLAVIRREQARSHELAAQFRLLGDRARPTLALALLEVGSVDEARREYQQAVEQWTDVAAVRALLSELCHAFGDRDGAKRLYEELEPRRHLHVSGDLVGLFLGSEARYAGLAAETLGRPEEAAELYAEAMLANERAGAPLWRAHTAVDHARLLLAERGESERARAETLLAEARAFAEAKGLEKLRRRIEALEGPGADPEANKMPR